MELRIYKPELKRLEIGPTTAEFYFADRKSELVKKLVQHPDGKQSYYMGKEDDTDFTEVTKKEYYGE